MYFQPFSFLSSTFLNSQSTTSCLTSPFLFSFFSLKFLQKFIFTPLLLTFLPHAFSSSFLFCFLFFSTPLLSLDSAHLPSAWLSAATTPPPPPPLASFWYPQSDFSAPPSRPPCVKYCRTRRGASCWPPVKAEQK